MRESDGRAVSLRQLLTSATNANKLEAMADFEHYLIEHKRSGLIGDLAFTYAYNGLYDGANIFDHHSRELIYMQRFEAAH